MGRPQKKGLDYFPFDVGFWNDSSIRILKSRYHSDGISLYIHILCDIYREGYYLSVKSYEDYLCVLSDDLGITFDKVEQILTFICARSLLVCFRNDTTSKGVQEDAVFTSHGIQKRYVAAMKSRKKSVAEVKGEYWLLSDKDESELDTFYKSGQNGSNSEKNGSKSEKNSDNSENNPSNKIKGNNSKLDDINTEESKEVINKKDYQSYDEIFAELSVAPIVKDAIIEFIRHLQLNGVVMLNSRLERIIIELDLMFRLDNDAKVRYLRNAINSGYKRLPCEE